jgi:beta-glucanase (GH16 family)
MWEIDILEYVGENQILFLLLYTHRTVMEIQSTQKKQGLKKIEEGYHIYAMDWSKDKIDFFVDNNLVYTFNQGIKRRFGLIINPSFIVNLAIGGSFGDRMLTTRSFHKIFL